MNVYDFDKTIIKDDSTTAFYFYALRHYPRILKHLPSQLRHAVRLFFKKISLGEFKEHFMCYIKSIPDPHEALEKFWDERSQKVNSWYIEKHRDDDIVISASPEAIIAPGCRRLGITKYHGTKMDIRTGKFYSKNCKGEEKPVRFREVYGDMHIDEFYSDSLSDTPMALLADRSFLVKGEKLTEWTDFDSFYSKKTDPS